MKLDRKVSVVLLVVIMLFIQGCANSDKRLALNDLQKIDSLKVVRHESPKLLKATAGSQAIAITGVMFGALGGAFGAALSMAAEAKAGSALAEQCNLPDFGELVFNRFVERMPVEMAGWPKMDVEKPPVADDLVLKGYSLLIEVGQIRVKNGTGFAAATTARMVDLGSNVLWERKTIYTSEKFDRCTTLEELEADSGRLLREEFEYAAEKTVSDFIAHLKGEPSEVEKPEQKEAAKQEDGTEAGTL